MNSNIAEAAIIAVVVFDDSNDFPYSKLLMNVGFSILVFNKATLEEDVDLSFQSDFDACIVHLSPNASFESQAILVKKAIQPNTPIILIGPDDAVESKYLSAFSFCRPVSVRSSQVKSSIIEMIQTILTNRVEKDLNQSNSLHDNDLTSRLELIPGVIGKSEALKVDMKLARRVANCMATTMITGESGVGKEVFARAIHQLSHRREFPFVAINCSAIPENLLESELFGHAKGSFTGAFEKRVGLFEEAHRGTLFLDEIGDLSSPMQVKLLRVLQEKRIKRVGENSYRVVDVRIITATHKDLSLEVLKKTFREDLFFRLNVIHLSIPPLRERREDILPLAYHFLRKMGHEHPGPLKSLSDETAVFLTEQAWPGNVRELANAIERALVMSDSPEILISDLGLELIDSPVKANGAEFCLTIDEEVMTIEELVNKYVMFVLKKNNGVKDKTAKDLDIDPKTLSRRIRSEMLHHQEYTI